MIGLQKLIDEALLKEQEEKSKRARSGLWTPSRFGRCFRFQYWSRKNEPITNPTDIRGLRKFAKGNLYHEFLQKLLPEHQVEVLCKKDDIVGYADVVLPESVVDIKSIHTNVTGKMIKQGYDVYKDKESNWIQVATYSWILGKKFCGLLFVDENLVMNEYFSPTDRFTEKILQELATLRLYWEDDHLPPPVPRAYGGKECQYCAYQTKCEKTEGKNDTAGKQ